MFPFTNMSMHDAASAARPAPVLAAAAKPAPLPSCPPSEINTFNRGCKLFQLLNRAEISKSGAV